MRSSLPLTLLLLAACTANPDATGSKATEGTPTTSLPSTTPPTIEPSPPTGPVALDSLGFGIPAPGSMHATAFDVGDVTGDGVLDLLDLEGISGNLQAVRVLAGPLHLGMDLSAPDGISWFEEDLRGSDCTDVQFAGDVDGDGVGDVVCSGYENGYEADRGRSSVKLGPLLGEVDQASLQLSARFPSWSRAPSHAPLGDVDGDGADEVAVGWPDHPPSGRVVLADFGAASPPEASLSGPESFGNTIAPAGDVDGDGIIDLLVADESDLVVLVRVGPWLAGESRDAFTTRLQMPEPSSQMRLAAGGDVDGDGVAELVLATHLGGGHTCLVPADVSVGQHLVEDVATACWQAPDGTAAQQVSLIDDLDGDGLAELIVLHTDGRLFVLPGADVVAGAPLDDGLVLLGNSGDLRVADVDGDGVQDLLVALYSDEVRVVPGVELAALLP